MVRTERARRLVERAAQQAEGVIGSVADAGGSLVDRIEPTVESAVQAVGPKVRAAGPRVKAAGAHRLRRSPPEPLPNLYDLHPEARFGSIRELGVFPIPADEIVGTAVEGPAQRGTDFLPLPPFRSKNWEGRWQRIRAAVDRLSPLPPIDVLKAGGRYWVRDGHNRVAAARLAKQVDIDAVVTSVQLPGEPPELPPGPLAPVLADAVDLQAAGRGILSPGDTLAPYEHAPHLRGVPRTAKVQEKEAQPADGDGNRGEHDRGTGHG
jgi:hypothetical protein